MSRRRTHNKLRGRKLEIVSQRLLLRTPAVSLLGSVAVATLTVGEAVSHLHPQPPGTGFMASGFFSPSGFDRHGRLADCWRHSLIRTSCIAEFVNTGARRP